MSDVTPRPPRRPRLWLLGVGLLSIATASAVGWVAADARRVAVKREAEGWPGRVAKVVRSGAEKGGGLTVEGEGTSTPVVDGAPLAPGTRLVTDPRTRARLEFDDGSSVVLERATDVSFARSPRALHLHSGAVIVEPAPLDARGAAGCSVSTEGATVVTDAGKVLLTADGSRTVVEVVRGLARVTTPSGETAIVETGQEGSFGGGRRPEIVPANDLAQRAAFGEGLAPVADEGQAPRGLGELRARRPGSSDEKDHAVRLARHDVKVRIVGSVAKTEIDETFANDTDAELEGVYRFPVPPGAQIERLALEVDGKLVEGSFVERGKGAAIWRGVIRNATPVAAPPKEEIIWVPGPWRDPALLEWQRGGRAELKIFPIPRHGSRRVVLSYTETVAPSLGTRRYVYPLPQGTSSDLAIEHAAVDVQVLGADPQVPVRTRGYELQRSGGEKAVRFTGTMDRFVPSGDLTVEYALADRETDATAWAYTDTRGGRAEDAYVAIALRPKLPKWTDARPRDQVLVVDGGRAMFGERFQRARRLVAQVAREMDRRDRVTVLVCDPTCSAMPGGFRPAGAAAAREIEGFLAGVAPEGASDLVGAVREVSALPRDATRDLRVVMVSAGLASAGYRTPERIAREVAASLPDPRTAVVAVPVGHDADLDSLAAVARGGGGVVVPYQPGERLESAALAVLGATYGTTLRDVELKLPEGLTEVAPRVLPPLRPGSETLVAARLKGDRASGDIVLRGTVGGEPFEARYPITVASTTDDGNAFVPRLYAAARIADREREPEGAAKAELVALSSRYAVPSKYTSLLVLESEAMFTAFGIDRTSRAVTWSGEGAATAAEAQANREEGEREHAGKEARAYAGDDEALGDRRAAAKGAAGPSAPSPTATAAPPSVDKRDAPAPPAASAALPPPFDRLDDPMPRAMPRRRGQWMKREYFRVASVRSLEGLGAPSTVKPEKIDAARAALAAAPDERKRHAELARLLSLAGDVEGLQAALSRWSERDPLDAEAIAARADLLAQTGRRGEALRVLGGLASTRQGASDPSTLSAVAAAYEQSGLAARGCAFRVAAAELRPADLDLVARAVACERQGGHAASASRWIEAISEEATRTRLTAAAARLAEKGPDAPPPWGDVVVDATWDEGAAVDLDVAVFEPSGARASCVTARPRGLRASGCTSLSREVVAVTNPAAGTFTVGLVRGADSAKGPVSGKLRITSAGTVRVVPFTMTGARLHVAAVDVRYDSRLVAVPMPL